MTDKRLAQIVATKPYPDYADWWAKRNIIPPVRLRNSLDAWAIMPARQQTLIRPAIRLIWWWSCGR